MRGYSIEKENNDLEYPVSSWTDYSLFPDIVTSRQTADWFIDISLQALPEDGVTEEDFSQVLEMFSRRLGTELRFVTSIAGKTLNHQHNRPLGRNKKITKFPTVKSDQGCRIYVYSESKKPFLMDLFLKTEWILNVFGAAGIVMIVTLINRKRTQNLTIQKSFKSMRSTRLPTVLTEEEGASEPVAEERSHDPETLQDTIAPLERHQLLHTRVTGFGAANIGAETEKIIETPGDLPPSYSLLDIELPDYNDL